MGERNRGEEEEEGKEREGKKYRLWIEIER